MIADVGRLPEWKAAIEAVVDKPPALGPGAEWAVRIHPARIPPWDPISRVEEIDPQKCRFAYETRNADGNPRPADLFAREPHRRFSCSH